MKQVCSVSYTSLLFTTASLHLPREPHVVILVSTYMYTNCFTYTALTEGSVAITS